jgi:hypothetical protein
MRLEKKILLRPKCEHCGERIYRSRSPFSQYLGRKIPSHCPNCGKEISLDKKEYLIEHEALLCLLLCIVFITVILVIAL